MMGLGSRWEGFVVLCLHWEMMEKAVLLVCYAVRWMVRLDRRGLTGYGRRREKEYGWTCECSSLNY
jgi:hypothetical protein